MRRKYQRISWLFFKNHDGDPYKLTDGQADIFRLVYDPDITRVTIRAVTQYGKSDVSSMAIILMCILRKEKVLIISPSLKQSAIIMGYLIEHLFDHSYITSMIEYEGSLERLRQERSKTRITFKSGGEVMILTAEAEIVAREAKVLMGFGASTVIVDESSLIPDLMFSKILRMIGGARKGKLVKLGNPFERNHFYRSFFQNRYTKLVIKWQQALAEGRITQDFIDECKEDMPPLDFTIFYDCEFPEGGAEDSLIPYDWIQKAVNQEGLGGEMKQAGLDVARFGRDKTVYCFRIGSNVERLLETQNMDTMSVVGWTVGHLDKDKPEKIAVDVIGIGSGVYDRLEEVLPSKVKTEEKPDGYFCEALPINVGESPSDDELKKKFYNLRAEVFWNLRDLFKPDANGKSQISIPDDTELKKQLIEIRYKYSSERKIKIEDKEDMKKRLGGSPDKADALALAFFNLTATEPELIIV